MKIAIIGCPGSGKSTLAKKMQELLRLPLHHLDQYFWKPGWQRPDRQEFAQVHHALCNQDAWIIEGMATRHFDYRAEKADIIIFLDVSLWRCLYRIFKRACTGYGQLRDTSAPGCPERMPDREFISYVLSFNRKHKPMIQALCKQYQATKKIFIVRNNRELHDLLALISSAHI
jgi:adenylate kinase family enzyme